MGQILEESYYPELFSYRKQINEEWEKLIQDMEQVQDRMEEAMNRKEFEEITSKDKLAYLMGHKSALNLEPMFRKDRKKDGTIYGTLRQWILFALVYRVNLEELWFGRRVTESLQESVVRERDLLKEENHELRQTIALLQHKLLVKK